MKNYKYKLKHKSMKARKIFAMVVMITICVGKIYSQMVPSIRWRGLVVRADN